MAKNASVKKKVNMTTPVVYFLYLLIVWSLYRVNFKFSDVIEELYVKPIIWLLPFLYILPKGKIKLSELGITLKNLFPSVYLSIALGVGFAFLGLISNIAKYRGIDFEANIGPLFVGSSILLSFATAATEELVFRGYLLGAFIKRYKEGLSTVIIALLWTGIHAPISYFVWGMNGTQIAVYLGLTFIYGLGASILFLKTKNIAAPIFLHVLWEWPIVLFR